MAVRVSVSITFTAESRDEAIGTVASWTLHQGSTVTLMVEDPERAVMQPTMEMVGIQDVDQDGHIDVLPGTGGIELPPGLVGPAHPIVLPPDQPPPEPPPPDPPVAAFTYELPSGGVGRGDVVTFDASDTTGATDYAWTFGGGGTATGVTVTHAWSARGNFDVTLTATGPGGSAKTTQTVIVG